MVNLLSIFTFAQSPASNTPPSSQPSLLVNLMPIIFIFGIFYFLLIRPQKKKQEEHRKMVSSLNKNDEVVTSGGIHGTVVNVKEETITLRIDDNVRIEIQKSAVGHRKKK